MRYLIGLIFFLSTLTAQVTDKNFNDEVGSGVVLVKFTAPYQYANLDPKLFDGIEGHEGCVIIEVESDEVKKVIRKLRIRNFPSIALFYDGSKKEVWKINKR